MKHQNARSAQRSLTFFAVLLHVACYFLPIFLPIEGNSITSIASQYSSQLVPSGFTFGIWGIICVAFIVYGYMQLKRSNRHRPVYDKLNPLVITVNLLSAAWLFAFSYGNINLSLLLMLAMVFFGAKLFRRAKQSVLESHVLTVPFSLFLGCITVAAMTNISIWFISLGWRGGYLGETNLNIILIGIASAAAVWTCLFQRDWLFTLVVAWGVFGIWSVNLYSNPQLSTSALIAAITLMIWVVGYLLIRYYSANTVMPRKIRHSL